MTLESCFHLESDSASVQLWTDKRLPFEPTGQMLDARNSLRSALRRLAPGQKKILLATYSSLDQSFCDVENILLYNVGAATFESVATTGVRFDRIHIAPSASPSGRHFKHHHYYRLGDVSHLTAGPPDVSLTFLLNSLTSSTKPHEIWWPASDSGIGPTRTFPGSFEMRVVLRFPSPFRNLTAVIKPLLDGVICAFHSQPNPDLIAVKRLGEQTGLSSEMILNRLQFPRTHILGPRRLLDTYRDFVKWNPADELCEACTVLYEPSSLRQCIVDVWDRQKPQ
jgi:hypothetical protein